MNQFLLNFSGGFMYFPEDKSGYIPAALQFVILIIIVVATFRWIKRMAKRQELKTKELEARVIAERDARMAKEIQE